MTLRQRDELRDMMAEAISEDREFQGGLDETDGPRERAFYRDHGDYMRGVADALAWTLGERDRAPITGWCFEQLTEEHMVELWRKIRTPVLDEVQPRPPLTFPYVQGVWRALEWALFAEDPSAVEPALYC